MDEAESPSEFDFFYHYDSASSVLEDDKLMKIKVPAAGFYYVSLSNIFLTLDPNTPPTGTALLSMEKFESINNGSCSTGNPKQSNKVLFPLDDPSAARPGTRVYNRILLATEDYVAFNLYDIAFVKYSISRLVVTVHVSSSADIIRSTL